MATRVFAAPRDVLGLGWVVVPLTGLAALLGVIAVYSPVVAFAGVVGLVFVALAMRNLALGLCLFTILTFFEQIPGLEGSGLSMTKLAGGVLVISWLLIVTNRRSGAPMLLLDRPVLAAAAIVFVAWALASRLWASDIAEAAANGTRLMLGVILVFIVFTAIQEPRHIRWLLWSYLAGAFLSALVGLGETSPDRGSDPTEGRLAGGIADPNELAAILVPAMAFASFALAAMRGTLVRLALVTAMVVFSIALFLTESRGGLIGLAVTFVVALILAGPMRPQALVVILIVSALGISYYTLVAPPESLERVTEFSAGSGTGRTDLWSVAGEIIGDHPLVGVGVGNFQVVEPFYAAGTLNLPNVAFVVDTPKVAHNTYLEVFAELGLIGLLMFGAILVASLVLALRAIPEFGRRREYQTELFARGYFVGVCGLLAAFVFISGQYEKQLWLLVGATAALSSVARRGPVPDVGQPDSPGLHVLPRPTAARAR
jgi:O-antigen ligase